MSQQSPENSAAHPNLLHSTATLPWELPWSGQGQMAEGQRADSLAGQLAGLDLDAVAHQPPPSTAAINA